MVNDLCGWLPSWRDGSDAIAPFVTFFLPALYLDHLTVVNGYFQGSKLQLRKMIFDVLQHFPDFNFAPGFSLCHVIHHVQSSDGSDLNESDIQTERRYSDLLIWKYGMAGDRHQAGKIGLERPGISGNHHVVTGPGRVPVDGLPIANGRRRQYMNHAAAFEYPQFPSSHGAPGLTAGKRFGGDHEHGLILRVELPQIYGHIEIQQFNFSKRKAAVSPIKFGAAMSNQQCAVAQ